LSWFSIDEYTFDAAWMVATLASAAVIHFLRRSLRQFFSSSEDDGRDEDEEESLEEPRLR
jgi:hypothetical protein